MIIDSNSYSFTDAGGFRKICLIIGIVGIAASVGAYIANTERFYFSYLVAFMFWTTLSLGALFFVMMHHLTNATWSVVIRKIPESMVTAFPLLALFFIPLVFGISHLYHWSDPDILATDHLLQGKTGYLNIPFFLVRAVVFFGIWTFIGIKLYRLSCQQDKSYAPQQNIKFRKVSAIGMVLFAFSVTYAGFDWLMSLDAHWYSTIFGIYVFAGGLLCAFAFVTVTVLYLRSNNILKNEISREHYHDLGKLTFAFLIFWGYVAFSQYFLIWYANIPEETIWFSHRYQGSWKYISLLLVFGHFTIPFLTLISRGPKRNLTVMKIMALWLIFMHWVDLYWIIMPVHEHHHAMISWIDIAVMFGIGGIYLWYFWGKLTANPIIPINDPKLKSSLKFTNI